MCQWSANVCIHWVLGCVRVQGFLYRERRPNQTMVISIRVHRTPVYLCQKSGYKYLAALLCSWVLFGDVLNAKPDVKADIVVPWIIFYAIATVVSTAALYMHRRPRSSMHGTCLQGNQGASFRGAVTRPAQCSRRARHRAEQRRSEAEGP